MFFWIALERQVQISGSAVKIPTAESLKYFATPPKGSQIGAWCSQQSNIISSRQILELKFDEIKRKFQNQEIPLPSAWGSYRVVPDSFEFWQGKPNRLHDRFLNGANAPAPRRGFEPIGSVLLFDGNQQDRTASLLIFPYRQRIYLADSNWNLD